MADRRGPSSGERLGPQTYRGVAKYGGRVDSSRYTQLHDPIGTS